LLRRLKNSHTRCSNARNQRLQLFSVLHVVFDRVLKSVLPELDEVRMVGLEVKNVVFRSVEGSVENDFYLV
jgi:hypothetical protein